MTLHQKFKRQLELIERYNAGQPADLAAAIKDLPAVDMLPWPEYGWALAFFAEHALWLQILRESLGETMASRIHSRARDITGNKEFMSVKLTLDDRVVRTFTVSVDNYNRWVAMRAEGSATFVIHSTLTDVPSWQITAKILRAADAPEMRFKRLLELHPSGCVTDTLDRSLAELHGAGLICRIPDAHGYSPLISNVSDDQSAALAALMSDFEDGETGSIWGAALMNDWPLVLQLAEELGKPEIVKEARRRADKYRRLRLAEIEGEVDGRVLPISAALRINALGPDELWNWTERHPDQVDLKDWVFEGWQWQMLDARWCPRVFALLATCHRAYFAKLARFLIDHNYRVDDVMACIAELPLPDDNDGLDRDQLDYPAIAVLLLQHDPQRSLPFVRRALRLGYGEVAHLLGAIDNPWARQELMNAFESAAYEEDDNLNDGEVLEVCIHGLMDSRDPTVRQWIQDEMEAVWPDFEWNKTLAWNHRVLLARLGVDYDDAMQLRHRLRNYASVGGP